MSRVAVSGATGLIGARVAEQLGKTHDVVRLGRRDAPDIRVDFREPADVARLPLHGISAFIHCAGVVDADFQDDRTGAYVQSTASIVALVDRVLAEGVSRFVYISTAHVYGRFVGRIDETNSPQPISDYAIAHFAAEQIIRRRADSKFIPLILRPCAVFGIPRKLDVFDRWSLIPFGFPREAATAHKIVILSTGEQKRNFVATDDIASVIERFLARSESPAELMNPVGPEMLSVYEFALRCATIFEAITGERCAVERKPPAAQPVPEASFEFSSVYDHAKGSTTIDEFLSEMIGALIQNTHQEISNGSFRTAR